MAKLFCYFAVPQYMIHRLRIPTLTECTAKLSFHLSSHHYIHKEDEQDHHFKIEKIVSNTLVAIVIKEKYKTGFFWEITFNYEGTEASTNQG